MSIPATCLSSSPDRWCGEPVPELPKASLPGFFFAQSMRSYALAPGMEGCTHRMIGTSTAAVFGVMSLTGS